MFDWTFHPWNYIDWYLLCTNSLLIKLWNISNELMSVWKITFCLEALELHLDIFPLKLWSFSNICLIVSLIDTMTNSALAMEFGPADFKMLSLIGIPIIRERPLLKEWLVKTSTAITQICSHHFLLFSKARVWLNVMLERASETWRQFYLSGNEEHEKINVNNLLLETVFSTKLKLSMHTVTLRTVPREIQPWSRSAKGHSSHVQWAFLHRFPE